MLCCVPRNKTTTTTATNHHNNNNNHHHRLISRNNDEALRKLDEAVLDVAKLAGTFEIMGREGLLKFFFLS